MINPFVFYIDTEKGTFRARVQLTLMGHLARYLVSVTEHIGGQPGEIWFSVLTKFHDEWIQCEDFPIQGNRLPLFLLPKLGLQIEEEFRATRSQQI